jgi:putative acetyltransferase
MANAIATIRAERDSDRESVHAIVAAAFGRDDEADLVARIRASGAAVVALVAELGSSLVGHVLASPIAIDDRAGSWLGIAPLSVLPASQGQGIGGRLMTAMIDTARQRGTAALFLLGNPRYYSRFGFITSHIGNEYGARDAIMHLEIEPHVLDGLTGTARYVPAFAEGP